MATLHIMVGLPCSGKTTRARALEAELPALRLTPDEWHLRLFGQDADAPEHDQRHGIVLHFFFHATVWVMYNHHAFPFC